MIPVPQYPGRSLQGTGSEGGQGVSALGDTGPLAPGGELEQQKAEIIKLRKDVAQLPRLRSELAQLKQGVRQDGANNRNDISEDPFEVSVLALAARAAELNRHLQAFPVLQIPELQYLQEADWLSLAKGADYDSEEGIRLALSKARQKAKTNFAELTMDAWQKFSAATNGLNPASINQLLPYFKEPVEAAVLERYQIIPKYASGALSEMGAVILSEKAPVDRLYDTHFYIGRNGWASFVSGPNESGDPDKAWATR